jgi:hypothetical protein
MLTYADLSAMLPFHATRSAALYAVRHEANPKTAIAPSGCASDDDGAVRSAISHARNLDLTDGRVVSI